MKFSDTKQLRNPDMEETLSTDYKDNKTYKLFEETKILTNNFKIQDIEKQYDPNDTRYQSIEEKQPTSISFNNMNE